MGGSVFYRLLLMMAAITACMGGLTDDLPAVASGGCFALIAVAWAVVDWLEPNKKEES